MKIVKDILKGILIGVANAIPGVSGGTMMVSMGIYDDIIYCITHLFKQLKKSIMTLLPYLIGMAIGIVGLAFAIGYLLEHFEFQTKMAFIGLILGGVPLLFGKIKEKKKGFPHACIFLLFFVAIIAMEYFGGESSDVTLKVGVIPAILIFLVGVIASATMVIPGVSGSMMLMILGYYNPIMAAVKDFVVALTSMDISKMITLCGSLVPFGLGVVIGIFAIAKLIEVLLQRYEVFTYCGILGLVMSSPVVILMGTALVGMGALTWISGIVVMALGILFAWKLAD
ncbi:MAG: DUF368 domain-containing protein [Lachnospiraceae bacterium]|nr:DUF368 domain-containing protein [Lachnospiraceae bacterium]